mmetsp:Transcript_51843/g.92458  ORF Transcript_51843/g.92458 Transcript_51843/m.92458 type:complete len:228 (+) Transcript_51843:59-742(+)
MSHGSREWMDKIALNVLWFLPAISEKWQASGKHIGVIFAGTNFGVSRWLCSHATLATKDGHKSSHDIASFWGPRDEALLHGTLGPKGGRKFPCKFPCGHATDHGPNIASNIGCNLGVPGSQHFSMQLLAESIHAQFPRGRATDHGPNIASNIGCNLGVQGSHHFSMQLWGPREAESCHASFLVATPPTMVPTLLAILGAIWGCKGASTFPCTFGRKYPCSFEGCRRE